MEKYSKTGCKGEEGGNGDVLEVFKVVVVFIFDLLDPESAL
jgi:hypothetical protein